MRPKVLTIAAGGFNQAVATGQALSAAPAYFSGTTCPVQAIALAVSGTVTRARTALLSKDESQC